MSATAPGRREMLWWHQARHCIVRLRLGASGRSAVGKGEAAPSEDEAAPSGSRLPASRAWLQAQSAKELALLCAEGVEALERETLQTCKA